VNHQAPGETTGGFAFLLKSACPACRYREEKSHHLYTSSPELSHVSGEARMSQTQALLGKIAALRQRLEQAQGLIADAGTTAADLLDRRMDGADPTEALRRRVAFGARQDALIEGTFRHVPGAPEPGEPLPHHLTSRARRLLPRLQELLARLRRLADGPVAVLPEGDPLLGHHRKATLQAELAARTLQTLPETPSMQLRLCEGVEALLDWTARRCDVIETTLKYRHAESCRVDCLAAWLAALARGDAADLEALRQMASDVLRDAEQALPFRFQHAPPDDVARSVACHSLNVAHVVARVVRGSPEWRGQEHLAVSAALAHDVGMLTLPAALLAHAGPLNEDQRRAVEGHAVAGAALLNRLGPEAAPLAEAAVGHHERTDGTGYPAGLTHLQIGALSRLLAACDVYAALCCPRPHRAALETRTALTDTLMLAQQGSLDQECAKELLKLSLYPAGTAVELADGACGVVVAAPSARQDVSACARPVVMLLTDGNGQPLPHPEHLDLAACEGRSIVRGLRPEERRQFFGDRYPEWAA
jgi:HD-GYP domain-containing protein (c-di-GMP phosphodiesterase class II)